MQNFIFNLLIDKIVNSLYSRNKTIPFNAPMICKFLLFLTRVSVHFYFHILKKNIFWSIRYIKIEIRTIGF